MIECERIFIISTVSECSLEGYIYLSVTGVHNRERGTESQQKAMGSSSSRDDRTLEVDEDNYESEKSDVSEESEVSETETSDGEEQEIQEEEQGKDGHLVSTKHIRCSTATFSSSEDEGDGGL